MKKRIPHVFILFIIIVSLVVSPVCSASERQPENRKNKVNPAGDTRAYKIGDIEILMPADWLHVEDDKDEDIETHIFIEPGKRGDTSKAYAFCSFIRTDDLSGEYDSEDARLNEYADAMEKGDGLSISNRRNINLGDCRAVYFDVVFEDGENIEYGEAVILLTDTGLLNLMVTGPAKGFDIRKHLRQALLLIGDLDVELSVDAGAANIVSKYDGPKASFLVLMTFKQADFPIADEMHFVKEDDPNGLMGQPGEYIAKVNFEISDSPDYQPNRRSDLNPDYIPDNTLEIFSTKEDAQRRYFFLKSLESIISSQYIYIHGLCVLRIDKDVPKSSAEQFRKALTAADEGTVARRYAP